MACTPTQLPSRLSGSDGGGKVEGVFLRLHSTFVGLRDLATDSEP